MKQAQARAVERLLKELPRDRAYAYRKAVLAPAPTELNPGERSDVSWISTEAVDRQGEVVRAQGMDDRQFAANPLVTLGHAYWLPPVGRSLWRKVVRDGPRLGIKAKTVYPPRPASWPAQDPWPPDQVLALVQAGLLQGKSIGFLPLKVHAPSEEEIAAHGWQGCQLVIDEWLLLEYACVFLPANQDALVEAVAKGQVCLPTELAQALGLKDLAVLAPRFAAAPQVVRHTPLSQIEAALCRRLEQLDWSQLVQAALERLRGQV